MLGRVLILWFLCLLCGPAAAQQPLLAEPRFDSVGDAGSIADGVVSAIAQDGSGFIWVGTSVGLVRFDGYQVKSVAMHNEQRRQLGTSFVRSILAARDGRLWVGTESDGLGLYDPAADRWTFYRSNAADPKSLAPGTVRALAQDRDGSIWVGTIGGGLDRVDPAKAVFQHFNRAGGGIPDDRIQSLYLDRRGQLWAGTWNGLARLSPGGQRFEPVFSDAAQPQQLAGKIISMLAEAPDGRLWVGTQQGELAIVDPVSGAGRWLARAPAGQGGSKSSSVYALAALNDTEVWVASATGLELRAVQDGALLKQLRHDDARPWGLAANDVRVLLRDAAGWIWVGSYGGGLQRHNPAATGLWVRRADADAASVFGEADVRSLLQTREGEIWVGTNERGVAVMDAQLRVIGAIRPQHGVAGRFQGGRVGGLAQALDGGVWVGTDTAVYEFSPRRELLSVHSAGKGRARCLRASRDGAIWIGTQDGLYRHDPGARGLERVQLAGGQTLSGDVNALVEMPDASLWVGGESGLYRVAAGARELQPIVAKPEAGLASKSVLGLLVDAQQRLWIDTAAGLHRLQAWDGRLASFERVAERYGFGGRGFGANLLADADGRIWTHRAVFDPADGRYYELSPADGADIGTGWFRAYAQLADGRLAYGGNKGLLVVEPGRFKRWAYAPPVVPTELRVDGERRPLATVAQGLTLAPGERGFSLEFAALDYSNPARNRYRYQLQGLDADWVDTDADFRVASYSNLSPGDYLLKVRGSNRVGDWSAQELSLPVHVRPTWWQTWWARALAVLLLGGLVYALVQWRTGYLQRQQLALEAKVRERTLALENLSQAMRESSLTDPLTGLRNRRFLAQHIEADVALAIRRHEGHQQHGAPLHDDADLLFFLVDVDHFKQVNDQHGHSAGDAVLQQMRGRLLSVFRDADYLVRWGGEEFLIVARATSRHHAAELAERARAMVADRPFVLDDGSLLHKTCSVGFACFPLAPAHARALDWSSVIDVADAALYAVKRAGRNGWLGVVSASAASDEELRAWRQRPLAEWLATGALQMAGSRERPVN